MGKCLVTVLLAGAIFGADAFNFMHTADISSRHTAGHAPASCRVQHGTVSGRTPIRTAGTARQAPVLGLRGATAQEAAEKTKKSPWLIVERKTARTAFLCNNWKNEAENARNLGWTSSSVETMIRMQREAATADIMKIVMPMLMAKAADEKMLQDNPAATPNPKVANMDVIAAVSVGSGSAAGIFFKGETFMSIDFLFCNTQMEGQLESQCEVVKQIVERAADEGISEVRLSANTFDCIFGDVADLGFKEGEAGVPWAVYELS